jgi:DNA modification methylase
VNASLSLRLARFGWRVRQTEEGWELTGNGSPAVFRSEETLCEWLGKQKEPKTMQQSIPHLNEIVTGDARELAELIPDESVDMCFTDPVYENTEDYAWLAQTCARILKPGGACLAWCSNVGQFKVQPVMSEHLKFILPLVYTKVAKAHKAFGFKTFLWSTPCLWFQKGAHDHEWLIDTVVEHSNAIVSTDTPPKDTYKWHKNPEAYIRWLQAFTKAGDIVYDPFTGSGSLPVECRRLGRNFIASELKPEVADMARKRLAEVQVIAPVFLEEQMVLI